MWQKASAIMVVLVFLITGGLGCKGLSSDQQQLIRPITLNYWTVFGDVDELRALATEYKQIRPYVTINIRQVRIEEFDNLLVNALADDVPPDLVSMHVTWLRNYQNRLAPMPPSVNVARVTVEGRIQPQTVVTPVVNIMPSVNTIRSTYVSTVAEDIILAGRPYGLPLTMDTLALYYNKELLDKSGVPLPPASWNTFAEAVTKGTRFNDGGDILQSGVALGTGNNIDNAFDILSLLMMQNGVQLEQAGRVTFADGNISPVLNALQFFTDFARPTKEVYSWNENMDDALIEFVRGRSVFYFGFAFDMDRIRTQAPQMKLGIIPVPQTIDENSDVISQVNVANYWVESVVGKSPHQDEAWDFVRFISTADNIKRYSEATGQPSPLRSHIAEIIDDPELGPFAAQALTAKNWYHGNNIEASKDAFTQLAEGYLQPYGEREDPGRRDGNLIRRASQIIGQTY